MTSIDYKSKFLKVYANIPIAMRMEIIAIVDGDPFTWNSAKIEIENDTDLGKNIIKSLINTEILNDQEK